MVEDEEKEEELEPFGGEEALALARQGKDAWNAWAKENPGRAVDLGDVDFTTEENKGISFDGFTFPGVADFFSTIFRFAHFEEVTFMGIVDFSGATVERSVWFNNTVFNEEAKFLRMTCTDTAFFNEAVFKGEAVFIFFSFDGAAIFNDSIFQNGARFGGATFCGPVYLEKSRFQVPPDFRRANFQKHATLHGIEVDFRRPIEESDTDLYRRLKELAVNARDHDREQMFFAYELIAKRGFETRGLALVSSYLYEITSNFGRSLARPSGWLLSIWFMFGIFYRWRETADTVNHIWDGLAFSAAQLFPFLGASRGALSSAKTTLYGDGPLSVGINALGMIEGGLGILFLFLIALALRNRFRI